MTACEAAPGVTESLDNSEREQLILEHLPQVRLIARRIYGKLPVSISLDDLISAGITGLIAAIDRYDPHQHVKLKTYAEHKIRGAILDSLRSLDWAPRQQRKRSKQIDSAVKLLEQALQRTPTEEEVAEHLEVSLSEYQEWKTGIGGLSIASLESASPSEDGNAMRQLADKEEHWPSKLVERTELQRVVGEAINQMPKLERTILNLYYYDEMTLREIAAIVGLHESRISQVKTQAIAKLRYQIQGCWPADHGARRNARLLTQ